MLTFETWTETTQEIGFTSGITWSHRDRVYMHVFGHVSGFLGVPFFWLECDREMVRPITFHVFQVFTRWTREGFFGCHIFYFRKHVNIISRFEKPG